ncbi:MAG: cupredoxin domain-containing protein [Gammaproteobacteria bacterium]|nr:cupredoxin domain-containing protein [Gammaproteobacteria bacterium]
MTKSAVKNLAPLLLITTLAHGGAWAAEAPAAEVEIYKFAFIPQEITVKVGDTVRWSNKEKRQYHSVWFKQAGDPEPDYFFPGESFSKTFTQPGSFPYRCGPHPQMTGIVHVR